LPTAYALTAFDRTKVDDGTTIIRLRDKFQLAHIFSVRALYIVLPHCYRSTYGYNLFPLYSHCGNQFSATAEDRNDAPHCSILLTPTASCNSPCAHTSLP